MKTPILGSSYVTRAIIAANDEMINLFPEIVPEGGKEPAFLNRCPGLRLLSTIGTGPIRGSWSFGGYGYVVSGEKFYKVDTNYNATELGNVTGQGPVSMADNGTQLFIACNPDGFIYNSATNVFQQILDSDFAGAVTVGYINEYFVFNEPNSQNFWVTSQLDGTQIDGLDYSRAIGSPDRLVALIVDHQEVWLFGTNSVEVWYDANLADFPLSKIQGAYLEIGCISPYTVAKLDNGIFWLGSDARGRGIVYRTNGYSGIRVSTHAVEWQIQQYSDISDAIGYTYQQDGHSFYVLTFPTANATWVYDVATSAWHKRAGFEDGLFTRHRSNCQMVLGNDIVVGDFENGNIYAFDLNVYSDNGQIQRWLRSWSALQTGQDNLKRTVQHSLQLDCQTGVGLNSGQGSNPQVVLRWSDDSGQTWSNEHTASMGKIGVSTRVIWRRLGMTEKIRDRVYEISGTDPVQIAIVGAELIMSPTRA